MSEMIIPTKNEFFISVNGWIWELTGEGDEYIGCGFCKAKHREERAGKIVFCSSNCLVYEFCQCADSSSLYGRWLNSDEDSQEREQANLEILQVLWEKGIELGYYKKRRCSEK